MNKQKAKKVNGVDNGLSPDMQAVREQILIDELKARHWRAQYETAYYHIEFEKILPAYKELIDKQRKETEEANKKHQEYIQSLKKEIEGIEVTPVEDAQSILDMSHENIT